MALWLAQVDLEKAAGGLSVLSRESVVLASFTLFGVFVFVLGKWVIVPAFRDHKDAAASNAQAATAHASAAMSNERAASEIRRTAEVQKEVTEKLDAIVEQIRGVGRG